MLKYFHLKSVQRNIWKITDPCSISVRKRSHNVNIHKKATAHALRRNTTVESVTSISSQVRKLKNFRRSHHSARSLYLTSMNTCRKQNPGSSSSQTQWLPFHQNVIAGREMLHCDLAFGFQLHTARHLALVQNIPSALQPVEGWGGFFSWPSPLPINASTTRYDQCRLRGYHQCLARHGA